MNINYSNTALILIGYQNDILTKDGILSKAIEESLVATGMIQNTINLLDSLAGELCIISTPMSFTHDYSELVDPVGILKTVKDAGAFRGDGFGSKAIDAIKSYGNKITEIPGKVGLNAFINTDLDNILGSRQL